MRTTSAYKRQHATLHCPSPAVSLSTAPSPRCQSIHNSPESAQDDVFLSASRQSPVTKANLLLQQAHSCTSFHTLLVEQSACFQSSQSCPGSMHASAMEHDAPNVTQQTAP